VTAKLHFDDSKLHHVAAKCGVFAETDIVNLVKSGIPSAEILCSLADAIVLQNLSVLTRGSTLKHKVLLLGGPNTYLPFLQECWRKRIPETGPSAATTTRRTPHRGAGLRARERAVLRGLRRLRVRAEGAGEVGVYAGLDGLVDYMTNGRKARLGESAGPPLAKSAVEVSTTSGAVRDPEVRPKKLAPGQHVRGGHRPRRREHLVEGRAGRRGRRDRLQGLPALQGQPDPGHEGAAHPAARVRHRPSGRDARGARLRRHGLRRRRAAGVRCAPT
jgi:hypothetical protein